MSKKRNNLFVHSNRILCIKDAIDEQTKGGLFIPLSGQTEKTTAKVAVVSDEAASKGFIVGDKVVYNRHAGMPVEYDGIEYLVLSISEVLLIIR